MLISILNQKGGCGKTTLALNIATNIADLIPKIDYKKVVMIDTDRQGSLSDWHAAGECGIELIIADRPSHLHRFEPDPDIIYVLDGASKADDMCMGSIAISDMVLVPIKPSIMDGWSIAPIVKLLNDRQTRYDGIPYASFVLSMTRKHSTLDANTRADFEATGCDLFDSFTTDRMIYKKTAYRGESVFPDGPPYTSGDRLALEQAKGEIMAITAELLSRGSINLKKGKDNDNVHPLFSSLGTSERTTETD